MHGRVDEMRASNNIKTTMAARRIPSLECIIMSCAQNSVPIAAYYGESIRARTSARVRKLRAYGSKSERAQSIGKEECWRRGVCVHKTLSWRTAAARRLFMTDV